MNIENLKRTAELVAKIPPENFDMEYYRLSDYSSHECGSVGCIVGHATVLDTPENLKRFTQGVMYPEFKGRQFENDIRFDEWSADFFDIDDASNEWYYMFGHRWSHFKATNTPEHAVYRINRIIDGYKPDDISEEIKKEFYKTMQ